MTRLRVLVLLVVPFLMAPTSGFGLTITDFQTTGSPNVTGTDDVFTCTVTITGTVQYAGCLFKSASGIRKGCFTTTGAGNDYACNVDLPADVEGGTWSLVYAFARSATGTIRATKSEVDGIGGTTTTVSVTSTSSDTTPPQLYELQTIPIEINPVSGGTVTCRVLLDPSDTGRPLSSMSCQFADPSGNKKNAATGLPYGCASAQAECSFVIPASAPTGFWTLQQVIAYDKAGNRVSLDSTGVLALPGGGDTSVSVAATSGDSCSRAADVTATNNAWANSTEQTPANASWVTLWAKATATGALVAISNAVVSDPASAAIVVRFGASGMEALDGAAYRSDNTYTYTQNVWERLTIQFDTATGLYSVFAGSCDDGPPTAVIIDASMQSGASTLNGLRYYASFAPTGETSSIADAMWLIFAPTEGCVLDTCGARNCGNPPDLCGGALASCGTCTGGDTCGGGGTPYVCGQ